MITAVFNFVKTTVIISANFYVEIHFKHIKISEFLLLLFFFCVISILTCVKSFTVQG